MLLAQSLNTIVANKQSIMQSLETLPQIGVGVLSKLEKLRPHVAFLIENFLHVSVGGEAILFQRFQHCNTMEILGDDRNARSF